jgi:hypothetical protein
MTTYLPDNTARLKVSYQGPRGQHTILFRSNNIDDAFITEAHTLIQAIANQGLFWDQTSFTGAQAAAQGSNVFIPVAWTAITIPADAPGAGNPTENDAYGMGLSINGRTLGGHRVRYFLFNVHVLQDRDSRITNAESAQVTAIVQAFTNFAGAAEPLIGIDRTGIAAIYGFADVNINKRIARRARRLG